MSVVALLEELGGVATRAQLIELASRAEVDRALRVGEVVAVARGRYCLPGADEALRLAHAIGGVLSHSSAALQHGWEIKQAPERPHVTVPRTREVDPRLARRVTLHFRDLMSDEITNGIATSPELTLAQSMRSLPADEALSIADSALRHGTPPNVLARVAMSARGPGSSQLRWVASHASADAANPFESCLGWVALGVDGLHVQPQRLLPGLAMRPDLVDLDLGLAIEADSFEWHGGRADLCADARRYNLMVVNGWSVLRFAWENVMFDQDYVRSVLVTLVVAGANPCCAHRCSA